METVAEHISTLEECESKIDGMLDDMLGEDTAEELEMKVATRAYVIKNFKGHADVAAFGELYLVDTLVERIWAFTEGYESCLEKHGA